MLLCPESGRVDTFQHTIGLLNSWLKKVGTDHYLRKCLVRYAKGRGNKTTKEIMDRLNPSFYRFAISQDKIGWRRFMEGMVSKEIASIQGSVLALNSSKFSPKAWMSGLITNCWMSHMGNGFTVI